jgi:hypothetical protein
MSESDFGSGAGTPDEALRSQEQAALAPERRRSGVKAFVLATIAAWAVFHGLPLAAIGLLPLADSFPVSEYTTLAAVSLAAFLAGVLLSRAARPALASAEHTLARALPATVAYLRLTAIPLTVACAYAALLTARGGYGNVDPVPTWLNLALYVNLTLLPVVLWNRQRLARRSYLGLLVAVILPRLVVSLVGPRFFVLQAVLPVVFWEALFQRIRLRTVALGLVVGYVAMFHVLPAMRNDQESGFLHLLLGSPINMVPQVEQMGLLEDSPALLVPCEIVASVSNWDVCGLRRSFSVPDSVRPRLDQAATYHARELTGIDAIGTGGNPVIEAFPDYRPSGNVLWFAVVGLICGVVIRGMQRVPLCCFLLPHVAAKGLFLWRGTIAEFFDRLPLLFLVYVMILVASSWGRGARCEK